MRGDVESLILDRLGRQFRRGAFFGLSLLFQQATAATFGHGALQNRLRLVGRLCHGLFDGVRFVLGCGVETLCGRLDSLHGFDRLNRRFVVGQFQRRPVTGFHQRSISIQIAWRAKTRRLP